jgi:hypothetical protein
LRELAPGVTLLGQHVDALELTCGVDQHRRVGRRPDDLHLTLLGLREQARASVHDAADVVFLKKGRIRRTVWRFPVGERKELVRILARGQRQWAFVLRCEGAWQLSVAPDGARGPRLHVQFASDYLASVGALEATRAFKRWATRTVLPLIDRRGPVEPVWRLMRVDLAADVAGASFARLDLDRFVSRSRLRSSFHG